MSSIIHKIKLHFTNSLFGTIELRSYLSVWPTGVTVGACSVISPPQRFAVLANKHSFSLKKFEFTFNYLITVSQGPV